MWCVPRFNPVSLSKLTEREREREWGEYPEIDGKT